MPRTAEVTRHTILERIQDIKHPVARKVCHANFLYPQTHAAVVLTTSYGILHQREYFEDPAKDLDQDLATMSIIGSLSHEYYGVHKHYKGQKHMPNTSRARLRRLFLDFVKMSKAGIGNWIIRHKFPIKRGLPLHKKLSELEDIDQVSYERLLTSHHRMHQALHIPDMISLSGAYIRSIQNFDGRASNAALKAIREKLEESSGLSHWEFSWFVPN